MVLKRKFVFYLVEQKRLLIFVRQIKIETMREVRIIYDFECGSTIEQVVTTDGSDTTIDNMVCAGDFIDFSFPSEIIACDYEILD